MGEQIFSSGVKTVLKFHLFSPFVYKNLNRKLIEQNIILFDSVQCDRYFFRQRFGADRYQSLGNFLKIYFNTYMYVI